MTSSIHRTAFTLFVGLLVCSLQLSSASSSANCPDECFCTVTDQISCEARGLTDIPQSIPSTVSTLDLGGNALRVVTVASLSRLTNVVRLKLSDNEIAIISNGAFIGTPVLQALDLSENKLTTLSYDAFRGATDTLLHLDLSNNQLVDIDGAFRGWSIKTS